jgi:DNA polymerase-4
MRPGLLRTAAVTGIREIGEVAALSVSQALALFGKRGPFLRSMAQGIDGSRVEEGSRERRIIQQADFNEDVIEGTAIRGAIEALAEHGGF